MMGGFSCIDYNVTGHGGVFCLRIGAKIPGSIALAFWSIPVHLTCCDGKNVSTDLQTAIWKTRFINSSLITPRFTCADCDYTHFITEVAFWKAKKRTVAMTSCASHLSTDTRGERSLSVSRAVGAVPTFVLFCHNFGPYRAAGDIGMQLECPGPEGPFPSSEPVHQRVKLAHSASFGMPSNLVIGRCCHEATSKASGEGCRGLRSCGIDHQDDCDELSLEMHCPLPCEASQAFSHLGLIFSEIGSCTIDAIRFFIQCAAAVSSKTSVRICNAFLMRTTWHFRANETRVSPRRNYTISPIRHPALVLVVASLILPAIGRPSTPSNLPSATSASSVVAVMASLDPQQDINPRTRHLRSDFTSRSLSHIPRFHDSHRQTRSENNSITSKEEMIALLRSHSRSTTSSSPKSSTSSCQSHLTYTAISPRVLAGAPVTTTSKPPVQSSSATSGGTLADASVASTNTLSPRERRKLLRSARKVGSILGETPVLCASPDTSSSPLRAMRSTEFGTLTPSPHSVGSNVGLRRSNSMSTQTRSSQATKKEAVTRDGVGSVHDRSTTPLRAPGRTPPVLKVDCALTSGTNKRSLQGSLDEATPDADTHSFVSTTTTTTMASDLFSPTTRRSPISPIPARLASEASSRDKMLEVRRSKVAKLSRHLGEHVPPELVFPDESTEPFVLVSYETTPPNSAIKRRASEKKVIEPPTRSSSLRRRRRKSLQLDLTESSTSSGSAPSTSSSGVMSPIGSAPSRYKPTRTLTRSRSVRSRTRKYSSSAISRSSTTLESENVRIYPASAPAIQTVHETVNGPAVEELQSIVTEGKDDKADQLNQTEDRIPLSDAQKAINVRRAQKMLSVFGEAPPNSLLPVHPNCESPVVFNRSPLGGRFKRHSICSIMTSGSSFIDVRESATFDSPISPMTPRPRDSIVGPSETTARTPSSKDGLKVPVPLSPRRRASLSALPQTPPPFSQYFEPTTPPSSTPIRHEPYSQSSNVPKSSRPSRAKTSPSTSSTSASPATPSSQQDPGAVFRERRQRAAKLARFFGVGYGDLFPVTAGIEEDARLSSSSFDTIRSLKREFVEKGNDSKITRVSVTVQREVDAGRPLTAPSTSTPLERGEDVKRPSTALSMTSESGPGLPELIKMTTTTTTNDWDNGIASTGCYGSLGFGTGLTVPRSPGLRRRRDVNNNTGTKQSSFGLGMGALVSFSLGRQSRGRGDASVRSNGGFTLGRKNSTRSTTPVAPGARALTIGDRRSILARSLVGPHESVLAGSVKKSEREPALVTVGEKVADMNEVMSKLRVLR
ncbi:uncharacterized protein FOMMEDRAFT_166422 [Fomitiporia mediterranea MF3/22]|uniref:uncharacterized protein n=1 Tax=Fomitiporia mediterranea (strain MF3/22) TaxID=694068 RepID=UPI00044084C9|nr:uncharacterized protein FOMMEDRAFT_166422 [Fomitiporia mediterranea MF3/22]EJD06159.1 hypothetical protein FOMMEDRAFT_166422 [Fomitiporia mediterranea MF3/22]